MAAPNQQNNSNQQQLQQQQTASKMHVLHCFDSIVEHLIADHLEGKKTNHKPVPHEWNGEKFPLFVTWKKRHGHAGEWRLRGCIGTFSAKELSAGLREYAVIAAFHDSRFSPIEASELSHLRCDISLLTRFEPRPVGAIADWEIGTHGIQIDFTDPQKAHKSYSATFLPEVAKEQGWTHEETIEELVRKSGYRGELTATLKSRIQLTRYQSEKESLTYDAYLALREKVVNGGPPQGKLVGVAAIHGSVDLKHKLSSGSSLHLEEEEEEAEEQPTEQQQKRVKLHPTSQNSKH